MGKLYEGVKYSETVNTIEKKIEILEEEKVNKEVGKQLSDENFTTIYKEFLDSVIDGWGTLNVSSNGIYDALGYAKVDVNVDLNLQEKVITPSKIGTRVTADNGYDGLSRVYVEGVTSAIDSNIRPENIKAGVTILGVLGTYEGE